MSQRQVHESLWNATTQQAQFPSLAEDASADVAIIGAGITGLTAALALKRAGRRVAVVDQLPAIADGMTGYTTAHLTEVFDTGLERLISVVGADGARAVWQAGRLAISHIEDTCREEGIDCDFTRVPGYLYAARATDQMRVQKEAEEAQRLGLAATYCDDQPLPQMVHGSMRVPNQAQFHPGKYLQALARLIDGEGCRIYNATPVTKVHHERPIRIDAGPFSLRADHLIYATQQPIHDPLFTVKVPAYDSYAIAVRVPRGTHPYMLAWDTNDPYYYWRLTPAADGEHDMLIVGGEDHRTGQVEDAESHHADLIAYTQRCLGGLKLDVAHRWQGQWLEPVDGLPFIGPTSRPHQYVGTGYSGNGMTMGTYAGLLIADQILGRAHAAGDIFDPGRLKLRGVGQLLSKNLLFPAHLAKDRLSHPQSTEPEKLAPGQGAVVRRGGRSIAVSRDESGQLHTCSAVCTHMGCLVHFNGAQQKWECPCHGSIFNVDGTVVAGPAKHPLKPATL